ncbi:hypothetical protein Cgig2_022465 [Carnegiea gigantea]|uniref:Aluminum-activated malate transporter n=1 Tax=Carnegiea gigantea TaxID=171969 RepID=A0A9Q1K9M3_9CARY|nr:hypothetical protein Cgig2_022465 [Carnegiea gigantea]
MEINVDSGKMSLIKSLPRRFMNEVVDFALAVKNLGQEDPRRIVHAFKVGLAITIVSLFYYYQPLYNGFGVSAMWAVLTVVVVFEFSVGATLGKGFNRMMATCVAGFLGVCAHHLASLSGKTGEPILLGIFGFLVAGIMTFMRFFPKMKARYDYGFVIFILTFCLVAVSGYRADQVIKIAQQRLSTIIIGSWIAMLICISIRPVWSGTELHNLIASNIHKLGIFLEVCGSEWLLYSCIIKWLKSTGFGQEFFNKTAEEKPKEDKSFRNQYKSVLGSKASEEAMANLAAWEPSHGRFKFRHPWKQYLKVGALARQCAYRVDALNTYLNSSVQIPEEIQENVKEACIRLSSELGKALKDLSFEIKKMQRTSSTKKHVNKSKTAAQDLKSLLETRVVWENFNMLDVLPTATVASILIDIVDCVESVAEEINELASMANFKSMDRVKRNPEKELLEMSTTEPQHVVVTIKDENKENDHVLEEEISPPPDSTSKSSSKIRAT